MTSRTHNAAAFAALMTTAAYSQAQDLTVPTIIAALIANIIGSLLPDADQESNRLWDLLPGGNLVGKIMKRFFLGHRSLSHSLLGLYLAYWGSSWLLERLFNSEFIDPNIVLVSLMIGYISHLMADGLTEEGLPLLFPIRLKFGFPPIKSWRIKTGKWFEKLVIFPAIMVYIIWIVMINWKSLVNLMPIK